MRRLLIHYDRFIQPLYPIVGSHLDFDLEAPFKQLPHLQRYKMLIICAIAATHESYRHPEWKIIAKVCREWADELVIPIITAWDAEAVIALIYLIIFELANPERGILWDLLNFTVRMCLQLGWHRRENPMVSESGVSSVESLNNQSFPESSKEEIISILKSIDRYEILPFF